VRGDADIYRLRKPEVPRQHLVAYFALVDVEAETLLLVDHINARLWLPTGGHVEPGEEWSFGEVLAAPPEILDPHLPRFVTKMQRVLSPTASR
jgi:hypothetical protein